MPRVSLCMVVRDEERLLPDCLSSARGVVDEMIVVDTGSRDATKLVAKAAGARVFDFAWIDDFAAARNEALRHARGEWILVLDADERLASGAGRRLRAALAGATFDCGMLRLHDADRVGAPMADVLSGKARAAEIQLVPRLLRRTPDLRYVDAIHENVTPWLRRRGMKVTGVEVDIVHYGATPEIVAAKRKSDRNRKLLEARVAASPHDLSALGYLAHEHLRSERYDEALRVAESGWAARDLDTESSMHRLATARAYLLVRARRYAEARETATLARAREGDSPDFAFFEAYAAESEAAEATDLHARRQLLLQAAEGYRRCRSFGDVVFSQAFVVGASSWYGAIRLGTVLLALDEPAQAREAFEAAARVKPKEPAAALGIAEAQIALGEVHQALAGLEPLLGSSPDGWVLAALAAERAGHGADARSLAGVAAQNASRGFVAAHRRPQLSALLMRLGVQTAPGVADHERALAPGRPEPAY